MLEWRYSSYCGLISPKKTGWFLIDFLWDGLDRVYHTKDILPGNIFLPDNNGNLYTVTRDKPIFSHTSLGMKVGLDGGQATELDVVTYKLELFAA